MEHAKRAHALFNASSADFWMECNLWVHLKMAAEAEGRDYDQPGEAAIRGTLCHEAAERALNARLEGRITEGALDEPDLTEEEIDLVETAVDAVLDLLTANAGDDSFEVWTEISMPLSHEPESDGHLDVLAYRPGLLVVDDHKYGEGAVSPNAHQIKIYGANALAWILSQGHEIGEDDVVLLAVSQPRLHTEALVRRYRAGELIRYRHHVEHVVENQRSRVDLRGASSLSTCEWCSFKKDCSHNKALVGSMFKKMRKVTNDDETIEEIVRSRSALRKVIEDAVERVSTDATTFPNWTRVQVQNGRKWQPLLTEEQIGKQLIAAGLDGVYGLNSPAKVRDKNKSKKSLVEGLSVSAGHHVRLHEGAPSGAPREEPTQRPTQVGKKVKSK